MANLRSDVPPAQTITIAVVEDEGLYRDLLVEALSSVPKFAVRGSYADGEVAHRALMEQPPGVVMLDIELAGAMTGVQLGLALKQRHRDTGVVWLSNYSEPYCAVSLARGVTSGWAYLLKKSVSDVAALIRAIEGAAGGLVVLDPQIVRAVPKETAGSLSKLTPRQREILALMAQGFTNAAIAGTLYLTEKSVENQINQIYQRLEMDREDASVQPRVRAVLTYLEAARR